MKTLLLAGLMLIGVSAQASFIGGSDPWFTVHPISFGNPVESVSNNEVPEWAMIPNAIGWFEVQVGLMHAYDQVMRVVLRGVIVASPEIHALGWLDLVPVIGEIGSPDSQNPGATPELGSMLLLASGLIAGWIKLRRASPSMSLRACGRWRAVRAGN